MEIEYKASDEVREVIASLGRTEDVRFSPSNRRLAIAAFRQNAVAVFDVEIERVGGKPRVTLSRVATCTSPCLNYPHGLDSTCMVTGWQQSALTSRGPVRTGRTLASG